MVPAAGGFVWARGFASATKVSTGIHDLVFSPAMAIAQYAVGITTSVTGCVHSVYSKTANGFRVNTVNSSGASTDANFDVIVRANR